VPSEPPTSTQLVSVEREIEKAAIEIGQLINGVPTQDREGLREFAHAVINQETELVLQAEEAESKEPEGGFNPLGLGVLLVVLGMGLSFLFGAVGALVAGIGLLGTIWGLARIILKRH
jgi:hypothetical protein